MNSDLNSILGEIEKRSQAATKGPWKRVNDANDHWGMREVKGPSVSIIGFTSGTDTTIERAFQINNDINFIAASRTDVPSLVKALRLAVKYVHSPTTKAEIASMLSPSRGGTGQAIIKCDCGHAGRTQRMTTQTRKPKSKLFKMLTGDKWEVRKCLWPYPEGYATYNPSTRTILDTGLTKPEAQAICDQLNSA